MRLPFWIIIAIVTTWTWCGNSLENELESRADSNVEPFVGALMSVNEFHNTLNSWKMDVAIMMFAPWCSSCKVMDPYWADFAVAFNSSISLRKFNCEEDQRSISICEALQIVRYPTILFIGYGGMQQGDSGCLFCRSSERGRMAFFEADMYVDALYDWLTIMSAASLWQRRFEMIRGALIPWRKTPRMVRNEEVILDLEQTNSELRTTINKQRSDMETWKQLDVYDEFPDYGDPFKTKLQPGGGSTAELRACVAQMIQRFCK